MNDAGYCATGGVCKNFPLLLEIGSPLTSLDDQLMMESLANYMTLNGLGKLPAINWACVSVEATKLLHSIAHRVLLCCKLDWHGHLHM